MINIEELEQVGSQLNKGVNILVNSDKNTVDITNLDFVGRNSDSGKSIIIGETRGAERVVITTASGKVLKGKLQYKLFIPKQ